LPRSGFVPAGKKTRNFARSKLSRGKNRSGSKSGRRDKLNQIAESHQGIVCFVTSEPEWDWSQVMSETRERLVFLDGVEDPHNLGAVMGSAWLLGAKALFIPEARAAAVSPAASKVAQGAAEHVPVVAGNVA
jgi:23S rRNA (guanosine2251-2'-O)-methyltransferase